MAESASVSENTDRHDEADSSDSSTVLKHGNTADELLLENNGQRVEAPLTQMEDNKDIFDGEQPGDSGGPADRKDIFDGDQLGDSSGPADSKDIFDGEQLADSGGPADNKDIFDGEQPGDSSGPADSKDIFDGEQLGDSGGPADDLDFDQQDAAGPSNGSNPLNGENSQDIPHEDILTDAVPHDSSESVNNLESNTGALLHDEQAEFCAADDAEADVANDDDDNTAPDAETEDRASGEHLDQRDAGSCEPSSEVVDAAHGSDVVDAPSPMDVDMSQPPDTGNTPPDSGCDGAMEVEYPTPVDVEQGAGDSTSCRLATDSGSNENDRESPMAEDGDDSGGQSCEKTAEDVSELQDHENVAGQSAGSDSAEFDEVDASQSKVSLQSEVSGNSPAVDETENSDGLVEGADFTVELQPDTSEQDSAVSEVHEPASESETAEKTGEESETLGTGESDKTSDDVITTGSDASTALPVSLDVVCEFFVSFYL